MKRFAYAVPVGVKLQNNPAAAKSDDNQNEAISKIRRILDYCVKNVRTEKRLFGMMLIVTPQMFMSEFTIQVSHAVLTLGVRNLGMMLSIVVSEYM